MHTRDYAGHAISGANAESIAAFERATHELRCFIDDPVASVDRAIQASPAMTMAYALKAWLHLLGTEPAGRPIALDCLEQASSLSANEREEGHLRAIRLLIEGEWRAAGRVLEDLSAAYPRDALALQAGHQIDFFTGDSRMLRDRIARALPAWSETLPGYHALLGMYAFGLEECGDYDRAEEYGRRSVTLEKRDGWAWHAVAHVLEMQGRALDGMVWLSSELQPWADGSFFAVHNYWHFALFQLELGQPEQVLDLFDGPIYGQRSNVVLDMIDASSLLLRLELRGVNVGDRWHALADHWAPLVGAGNYAFTDWHAMMAFVGSHRVAEQQAILESLYRATRGSGDNAMFSRDVGLPAALAIRAFGRGEYAETLRLLRPIRSFAHRFGGSHAQRDLIDLLVIEAALRSGQHALARAFINERAARRPESPLVRLLAARLHGGVPHAA